MQNRYTGDIGDFSKLGLLRALRAAGFSIGLNWYLTPDETHNGDGRHIHQHKARRKDPFYAKQLDALLGSLDFPGASGLALKFVKTSQRYYMFIIQPQHREAVQQTVKSMLATA